MNAYSYFNLFGNNGENRDAYKIAIDYNGNPYEAKYFINKHGKAYIHAGLKYSTIEKRVLEMCEDIHLDVRIDQYDTLYLFDEETNAYMFFAHVNSERDLVAAAMELLQYALR